MIILYQETWVFYQLTKTGEGKDSEEKREEKLVEKVNYLSSQAYITIYN